MKVTITTLLFYFHAFQIVYLQNAPGNVKKHCDASNDIVNITVNILRNCLNGKGNNIVTGSFHESHEALILKNLYASLIPISLISIHQSSLIDINSKFNTTMESKETYSAMNFIIIAPSKAKISESLVKVKNSALWNHEGFFLIVNTNIKSNCQIARDCLHFVWSLNILSVLFLCRGTNNKLHLFTYNPFSRYAPKFWKVLYTNNSTYNEMWTLLEHTIEEKDSFYDSQLCKELNFMKTKNLHGYKVNIGLWLQNLSSTHPEATGDLKDLIGEKGAIARTVWNHLNATANLSYYSTFKISKTDERIFHDLDSGKIDYILNIIFHRESWKRRTYPHTSSGLCIIAPKYKISIYERILTMFSITSWLILLGICFVAVVILKYILQETMSESALDILRMIAGMPTYNEPKTSVARKFFIIFVFVTMTANSYFQSRLNAMYVAPTSASTIETAEDLNASKLLIYGFPVFKDMLVFKNLRNRYRPVENSLECVHRLKKKEQIICLYPCNVYNITDDDGAHVAKDKIDLNLAFRIRKDWPLASRVNQILRRMTESGLLRLYEMRERERLFKYINIKSKWKAITIKKSTATFLLFSWCSLIAILIFILEIIINNFKKLAKELNRIKLRMKERKLF